jgi:hypothetical protein
MTLFEGLGANESIMGNMEMMEVSAGGRQDCRDCGVTDQVIPTAPVAIPETPYAPPKLPGGAPIVITGVPHILPAPILSPPQILPSPVDVQPPFQPTPIVEPVPVMNGDVFPHSVPMDAPLGARSRLPCC